MLTVPNWTMTWASSSVRFGHDDQAPSNEMAPYPVETAPSMITRWMITSTRSRARCLQQPLENPMLHRPMMLPMPFLLRSFPGLGCGVFHGCYFWFCRADRRELSDILACLRRCRCGVALTCVLSRGVVASNAILEVLDHVFRLVLQLIQKTHAVILTV
jgi:hypothetical protein